MDNAEEACVYPPQKRQKLDRADRCGRAVNLTDSEALCGGEIGAKVGVSAGSLDVASHVLESASHSRNFTRSPFPVEVLEIILAQLPLSQLYCRCRLVCRLWNDIIQREKVGKISLNIS